MAQRTWETIGPHALTAIEDLGGKTPITRDEVIELVGEDNHILYHGKDLEAYEIYAALEGWDEKLEILRAAFPLTRYGGGA